MKGPTLLELLEQAERDFTATAAHWGGDGARFAPGVGVDLDERDARAELRRQIGRLEHHLAELFADTYPRSGIDWTVGAAGGPRVLDLGELERVRDGLATRLAEVRTEVAHRADVTEQNRGLIERMIADPDEYHWVKVGNEDIGERECLHWHTRPRWGILGMLFGWWRVKLSSGCPLATGLGMDAEPAPTHSH